MFDQKRFILILLALLSLAACGQKGDLYLPEEQASSRFSDSIIS